MTIRRTSLCLSMLLLLVLCFALLPAQALAAGDFDTPRELEVLGESPAPVFRSSGEITVYFRDVLNWGSPYVYYWNDDGGDGPGWPGVAMTYSVNDDGESVYWAKIPAGITGIIFHTNVFQTVGILTDIVDGAMWYPTEQKDDSGDNYVEYVEPSQQPASEPSTQQSSEQPSEPGTEEPAGESAFYLVGSMTEWQTNDAYLLTKNEAEETAEYVLQAVELSEDDVFAIVETNAYIPDFTPKWYPEGNNNYVVTADGTYDVYFRPNGDGGEDWFYNCIYVVASEEPTEQPTQQPSEEPQTEAYYLVGTMNEWQRDNAYRLSYRTDGEYAIYDVELARNDEIKISSNSWTWYPDGADNNYVITADGTYDVHFRPNGDGGEGWYEGCIYVVASGEPGEEPTQQPTQQPTEEPQTEAYYLVGSMNGWSADNAYKLTCLDESEDDEYILRNVQLTTDDSFKIAYSSDGNSTWYPDGMGNSFGENGEIVEDGTYDVYFRPNYDGGEDWFYNCIYVVASEEPTEQPTEQPGDTITVYFTDSLYWGSVNCFYWDGGPDYPGTAMTICGTNDYGDTIYSAVIPSSVSGIIFNGSGNRTVDITAGIADGAMWYIAGGMESNQYKVGLTTYTPDEPPSEEPSEEPTEQPGDTITVYFTDSLDWGSVGSVNCYYWNGGPVYPGTAMTICGTNDYAQTIYSAVIPSSVSGIIFNGSGNQTVDITAGIADGAMWYTTDEMESNHYKVFRTTYTPTEQPSEEPSEEPTEYSITYDLNDDNTDKASFPASGYVVTASFTAPYDVNSVWCNNYRMTWDGSAYSITFETAPTNLQFDVNCIAIEDDEVAYYGFTHDDAVQPDSGTVEMGTSGTSETFTLTYNCTTAPGHPVTYNALDLPLAIAKPTRPNYSFAGWTGTGLTAATSDLTIPVGTSGDLTYTANWTPDQHTLRFVTYGGTAISDITQAYGTAITAPADPTRDGYTFDGWGEVIPTTMPSRDMTFYARWTPVEYSIEYNLDGGNMDNAGYTVDLSFNTGDYPDNDLDVNWGGKALYFDYDENWNRLSTFLIPAVPTADIAVAVSLIGYVEEEGDVVEEFYDFTGTVPAADFLNGGTVTLSPSGFNGDSISLSYEVSPGGGTNPETYTVESDPITLFAPAKEHCSFAGWTGTDLNAQTASVTIAAGSTGNRAYTAHWAIDRHTVSFAAGYENAASSMADVTVDYGAEYQLPASAFTAPAGMTFKQWSVKIGSADPIAMSVGARFNVTADTVVTAVWVPVFGPATLILPANTTAIGESAFEGDTAITIVDAHTCTSIGANAFKGCTNLTQIRLPKNCAFDATAFADCGDTVYVFAPAGGTTQRTCAQIGNCVFVEEVLS